MAKLSQTLFTFHKISKKQEKEAGSFLTSLKIFLLKKYDWAIYENVFAKINRNFTSFHRLGN